MPSHASCSWSLILLYFPSFRRPGDLGQAVDRLKETSPDLLISRTYVQNMPYKMPGNEGVHGRGAAVYGLEL